MGVLLEFPTPEPKSCYDCTHIFLGNTGSYCGKYNQYLVTEEEAEECEDYEPFVEILEVIGGSEEDSDPDDAG